MIRKQFIVATALVASIMPSLAQTAAQQVLIEDFTNAYIADRECKYPLNGDRIAADLKRGGLHYEDFVKGGRYEEAMSRELRRIRTMIGTPSVETFCGGLALRLGPKIATNAGDKPITAGIDWLSRSISPQQTEQMLNATQRFLEYVAED
jgi:hypothetical protein